VLEPLTVEATPTICMVKFDADSWHALCKLDQSHIIGDYALKHKDTSEHLVIMLEQSDILSEHEGGIVYRERIQPKPVKCCPTCGRSE
jgi:hypothetical protein